MKVFLIFLKLLFRSDELGKIFVSVFINLG